MTVATMHAAPAANAAEPFPSRPINVIAALTAGSVVDLLARALSDAMAKQSPQPFIVLNREGASGTIGANLVAKAKPDGYTVLFGGDSAHTVMPHVSKDHPYTLDAFDFVCAVAYSPMVVVVGPNSPYKTFPDLLEAARKATKPLTFATIGNASMMHLVAESIAAEASLRLTHIPFRSVADMNAQTINGSVDFTVTLPNILTLGRGVRALALTASEPMTALPDVPLIGTFGLNRSVLASVHMMSAPRGLPADVLSWLRRGCADAVRTDSFRTMTGRTHTVARHVDGEPLTAWLRQMHVEMGERVRRIEMKGD